MEKSFLGFQSEHKEQATKKFEIALDELLEDNISLSKRTVVEEHKKEGFDVRKKLKELKGPLIEIAGPTLGGYKIVDFNLVKDRIHVSNIYPGAPVFDGETGDFVGYYGKVNFQADAKRLPFGDERLGAIFISCLGKINKEGLPSDIKFEETSESKEELRKKVFEESWRILEFGGILVFQGVTEQDLDKAEEIGFQLAQKIRVGDDMSFSAIFEKVIVK